MIEEALCYFDTKGQKFKDTLAISHFNTLFEDLSSCQIVNLYVKAIESDQTEDEIDNLMLSDNKLQELLTFTVLLFIMYSGTVVMLSLVKLTFYQENESVIIILFILIVSVIIGLYVTRQFIVYHINDKIKEEWIIQ
jgi:general stress protein CsbA